MKLFSILPCMFLEIEPKVASFIISAIASNLGSSNLISTLSLSIFNLVVALSAEMVSMSSAVLQVQDLDLKGNAALVKLNIYLPDNSPITSVDLSDFVNLEFIDFANFLEINLSKNTKLKHIQTTKAPNLAAINVSNNGNLETLYLFNNNELSSLDVNDNLKLKDLRVRAPKLDYLNVRNNVNLETLLVSNAQLSAIDVSANEKLEFLRLDSLKLTSLDVSNNLHLKQLYCYNNNINALDLSNNGELIYLNCNSNQLTNLNLSNNTKIEEVLCFNNQIEGEAMNELISSLPQTQGKLYVVYPEGEDGNDFTIHHYHYLKENRWKSYYMTLVWFPYKGCYDFSGSEITDAFWPTDINSIEQNKQRCLIFDMSGRRMEQLTKGLHIINGKKAVIK